MYLDAAGNPIREASLYGYRAAGGAGHGDGARPARLREYGRLPRGAVMAPAIALARDGFVLGAGRRRDHRATRPSASPPTPRRRASFCAPTARRYRAGDRLVQPDLAATLALIAERGPRRVLSRPDRRRGRGRLGGAWRHPDGEADFAGYTVDEAPPLACAYRGYRIVSAPPPSSRRHDPVRDAERARPAGTSAAAGVRLAARRCT